MLISMLFPVISLLIIAAHARGNSGKSHIRNCIPTF